MNPDWRREFLLNGASALLAGGLFYLSFRWLFWWLLPFLAAILLAASLDPVVRFLQKTFSFQRGFSAALLTLFLLFLIGGVLSLLLTTLWSEAYALLRRLPEYLSYAAAFLTELLTRAENCCAACPEELRGYLSILTEELETRSGEEIARLTDTLLTALRKLAAAAPTAALTFATTVLAVFFTLSAYPTLCELYRARCPAELRRKLCGFREKFVHSLGQWLRAEVILCLFTFAQLLGGFLLMRQSYALLAAFLITLVDLLPVFGTGTVLVPWAVFRILSDDGSGAAALLALYACNLLVRSLMEPKLMAGCAGLPAVVSLFAMYLGFRLFGVAGMIFFPFLLLLLKNVKSDLPLPKDSR